MDLSVVAIVATIAAGVAILVAVAAVFAARRSTAHADLALKEASRISRASISRINEVQSEASSARLAARHAAERLRSMTKERTTPDSVAAYRVFLREVVEDSKHLLGPEGTGTMKNEALDRLRVGALVGGSDEVLRALRNFALLRTQQPEAPWPSAYAMAYARLESDLVTAIRNDLGSSEESLTADQIWGAVNARCVDPAFRLALLSPLEDVLRNAGQDPTHYDLDHLIKPADRLGPFGSTGAIGPTAPARSAPSAPPAGASAPQPRRRSRRAPSRVTPEASMGVAETVGQSAPAAEATPRTTTETAGGATTASTGLPDSSDVVWAPLSPGRRGSRATTATGAAPTAAPTGSPAATSAGTWEQAVAGQRATAAPRTEPAQPHPESPTSPREPGPQRPVFEDPTPSRISRRRRSQGPQAAPSTEAAAVPGTELTSSRTATAAPPSTPSSMPSEGAVAATASTASAAPAGTSTTSANTEETEPVFAPAFPEALTRSRAAEPSAPIATGVPSAAAPAQPAPTQPRSTRTRASSASRPPAASPVKATAVAAQTVTVPTGPQAGSQPATPAASAPLTAAAGAGGYGIVPPQGATEPSAQAPGHAGGPLPASSGPPGLNVPQPADQGSAVAAAGAVPTSAVGSHRAPAVPARTAARAGSTHAAAPDTQQTVTVTTGPSATAATTSASAPASEAWSFTPPSLQDSTEIPQARGA
ncbi:hypothetical protein [Actinomyces naeslundii]|uniref:hypothetical protein n=1 Tax=Actinomyces naeslundii TaxID=1655 RepID=UPI00209C275B|nr:hypothetical protein [Actinomyces naeslundii]